MKRFVHKREISIRTFELGDHTILVEGSLVDHRYPPKEKETPGKPEMIHHMVIRWKVKGPGMLIEEASATMPYHPNEECPMILPVIRNLEGLRIAPGFTMKIKKIIGGTKGCAHLTSLVLAMAEEAIQGYWAAYIERRRKSEIREEDVKNLIDTCHLWKEGGPILKGLRKRGGA